METKKSAVGTSEHDLKIVILKCPYANWMNPMVRDLFSKVVTLKLSGYQNKHFFGVMPVDGTDFVAEHILICQTRGNELWPVLGAKSLPYDICDLFHLDFTCQEFFRKAGNFEQTKALEFILKRIENTERRLSYFSSWTIDPKIRDNKEFVAILKELFVAAGVGLFQEEGITDLFGIGLPKFRTDQFFFSWGLEPASGPLGRAPDFTLPNFGGMDAVFMHLEKFSPYALEMKEKYRSLWESRLTLGKSIRDLRLEGVFEKPENAA